MCFLTNLDLDTNNLGTKILANDHIPSYIYALKPLTPRSGDSIVKCGKLAVVTRKSATLVQNHQNIASSSFLTVLET